jgi:L-fuculose-phosphate aldolase
VLSGEFDRPRVIGDMPSRPSAREQTLRRQIVDAGRRLTARGLMAASDGNLSVRLSPTRLLVTPAGVSKGRLASSDLLVVDLEGKLRRGLKGRRPSTETPMHLEVYRAVPSAGAVVHAHPPFATALTVAGLPFPSDVLPEIAATLGEIPVTAMAMPGSTEDAEAVRPWVSKYQAMLLPNHGSLTYGATLEEAIIHLERLEHAAMVYWLAASMGNVNRLPADLMARLAAWRQSPPGYDT